MYWFIPELFDLIKAALWPAVILIIFYCLKSPISSLIQNIKLIKHGDTSVHIGEYLQKIEEHLLNKSDVSIEYDTAPIDETKQDGLDESKMMIIKSWIALEEFLIATYKNISFQKDNKDNFKNIEDESIRNSNIIISFLLFQGYIAKQEYITIHLLRELRNKVVHSLDVTVTTNEAKRFSNLVTNLIKEIEIKIEKKNNK